MSTDDYVSRYGTLALWYFTGSAATGKMEQERTGPVPAPQLRVRTRLCTHVQWAQMGGRTVDEDEKAGLWDRVRFKFQYWIFESAARANARRLITASES